MQRNDCVHVVDDDEGMRQSLQFLLSTAGFEVELYDGAQALLDALDHLPSGCVLTDIRMPIMDGLELLRRIKASHKPLPVVVMTGNGDIPVAVEAMKLGASDFIEKPFDEETLLKAIRSAGFQQRSIRNLDPSLQEFLRRVDTLTPRERQVFDRLVLGDANKVIARQLGISPRTVEIFRANVMTKLQASGLSEVIRWAVQADLA